MFFGCYVFICQNVLRKVSFTFKAFLLCAGFSLQPIYAEEPVLNMEKGADIFAFNCMLCHGATGKGDGRLAKVITAPPPANLTKSIRSIDYMKDIVTLGGNAMQRSPQMPAWGGELSEQQVQAVVDYVFSLRL